MKLVNEKGVNVKVTREVNVRQNYGGVPGIYQITLNAIIQKGE